MEIRDFLLERFFAKYEFKAPYLMCSSDCQSYTIEEILSLDKGVDFNKLWLGYTEPLGHLELRKEIAQLFDNVSYEEVIVTAGAEEAIFIMMNILLKPGDHVIYMWPAYQSLFEIARSIGCELTPWKLRENRGWEVDLDELKGLIKPNTKLIILNNPHNPTGYLMSKDIFTRVLKIAEEKGIYLFSDEVYRYLEYNIKDRLPAACDLYEKGISLGVMSKSFGLAGLRIGWVIIKDQSLFKKFAAFKDYTSICNSAPSEFLSIIALKHKDCILMRNLEIINYNLGLLDDFFDRYSSVLSWQRPKAGSIAFPGLLTDEDVEEFCIRLVEKKGVLLLPGNYYGAGNKNFRIGFGRKNMPEALKLFEEFLQETYK